MEPSTIQGLKSKIMSKWPTCILCGSNSHTDARCDAEQAQEGAAGSSGGAVAQPPAGEATTSGQGAPGTHRGAASGEDAAAAAGGPAQDRPVCKNPGCNNVLANRIIKNGGTMCSKCLAMGYVKPSCKQCQCPLPEACVKNNVPICPVCLSGSLPVQESV